MMVSVTEKAFALCAAMLVSAALWAVPSRAETAEGAPAREYAQAASPTTPAPTPPSAGQAPSGQAAPTAAAPRPTERAEARIKSLHTRLHITAAQEPQWDAVAQVMRENAQAMEAPIQKRKQNASSMTAVDDLRSYQEIADMHASGLKKLVPAFEALYATMSDEQKKNADAIFSRRAKRSMKKSG